MLYLITTIRLQLGLNLSCIVAFHTLKTLFYAYERQLHIHDKFTPNWNLIVVIRYSINKFFFLSILTLSPIHPIRKKKAKSHVAR